MNKNSTSEMLLLYDKKNKITKEWSKQYKEFIENKLSMLNFEDQQNLINRIEDYFQRKEKYFEKKIKKQLGMFFTEVDKEFGKIMRGKLC